jgi:hypothetical protein
VRDRDILGVCVCVCVCVCVVQRDSIRMEIEQRDRMCADSSTETT